MFVSNTAGGSYQIKNSLRFRSGASANLNRTYAGTGTSATTKTISVWVKRGTLGSEQRLCNSNTASANTSYLRFDSADTLTFNFEGASAQNLTTTQVFRDVSAWYHVQVAIDTTQATASNRVKLYINGAQVTAFNTATYPAQNATTSLFGYASTGNRIGAEYDGSTAFFDGYMAEFNFIDGQALDPSYFGKIDSSTGMWVPKKYGGSYGTNGFYLSFSDGSAIANLGYDKSSSGNNWTPNGISLTAGTTYDWMNDTPTSNYATLLPTATFVSGNAFSMLNGNLTYSQATDSNFTLAGSTVALRYGSGKFYYEIRQEAKSVVGGDSTCPFALSVVDYAGNGAGSTMTNGYYSLTGNATSSDPTGTALTGVTTVSNGDVLMVAVDLVNGKLFLGKNGAWWNSGNPATGVGAVSTNLANYSVFIPAVGNLGGNSTGFQCSLNFGQQPFSYTAPAGFKTICTVNLSSPSITKPNSHFDVSLYTGTGATQTITGLNFQPDLVWYKDRNTARDHGLFDSVRGPINYLASDLSNAESAVSGVTSFNSNGFTLGGNTNSNNSGETYVAWSWKAGGAYSMNTTGTLTSHVSVNAAAGISVVGYTGNATVGATVGHGLGIKPSLIIAKARSVVSSWAVYHSALGATQWLTLNSANAETTSAQEFNNTEPTSAVFTVGNSSANDNQASANIAYCFAEVAGFSKFGKYTGNGSADGPLIYCGFQPRYVMIKRADSTGNWQVFDAARAPYNVVQPLLFSNANNTETADTNRMLDFLANGFKLRQGAPVTAEFNASGGTYIYAAFAEKPFSYANAR